MSLMHVLNCQARQPDYILCPQNKKCPFSKQPQFSQADSISRPLSGNLGCLMLVGCSLYCASFVDKIRKLFLLTSVHMNVFNGPCICPSIAHSDCAKCYLEPSFKFPLVSPMGMLEYSIIIHLLYSPLHTNSRRIAIPL